MNGWEKALVAARIVLCAALVMLAIEGIRLERATRDAINLDSPKAVELLKAGKDGADSMKDAAGALKETADAAKPVLRNAAIFLASGDSEIQAKSHLLDAEINNVRRLTLVQEKGWKQTFDNLNGNPSADFCPPGSSPAGRTSLGAPLCSIPGLLPSLSLGAESMNRSLARLEDILQQPEWKLIAPEALAMVKHWKETGANIETITADLKKMADNAVNPKKKSLWLSLLGIIVGHGIQGLVQR